MRNYINPRAFNREIKGYKDKYFKQNVADNNCTNEIKLQWLYARLKRVVKGRHWINKHYLYHKLPIGYEFIHIK